MKNPYLLLLLCISLLIPGLLSCDSSVPNTADSKEWTDDLGRKVVIKTDVKRVVSLTPSITELLGLICQHDQLVGRTQHCNYPLWVSSVPILSVYPLDLEALLKLNPDLVLVKDGFISTAHLEKLQSLGVPIFVQKYTSLNDIFRNAKTIGALTGNNKRGMQLSDSLIAIKDSLNRTIPVQSKTAVVLIGSNPIYVYGQGSFCDDILTLSGIENKAGKELHGEFPTITPEYLLSRNPDVLLGTEGIFEEDRLFTQYTVLKSLSAYQKKRYYIINSDLFSRPGPRIFQSVGELRALK
jgi:iron complex transport system substrate-binding protein